MAKSNAIGWFDIYVNDMQRAVTFYERVFQQKLEQIGDPTGETQMMSFPTDMQSYGAGGALVKSNHARPGFGGTLVYFSVGDCAVEQSRVAEAGGKVVRVPSSQLANSAGSLCARTPKATCLASAP
jgi:uncharacterized protein